MSRRAQEGARQMLVFVVVLILAFIILWIFASRRTDPDKMAAVRDALLPIIDKLKGG